MTGPWWNWNPAEGPVATSNGVAHGHLVLSSSTATWNTLVVDGFRELNHALTQILMVTDWCLWGCAPVKITGYANRQWV